MPADAGADNPLVSPLVLRFRRLICLLLALGSIASMAACASGPKPEQLCAIDPAREERIAQEIQQTLFDGEIIRISLPGGGDFLAIAYEGEPDKPAVIGLHGPGQHAGSTWVTSLASALNDRGYSFYALQMPVQRKQCESSDAYPQIFPKAIERITAGAQVARASHPAGLVLLGDWLANSYLGATPDAPFDVWVVTGLTGAFRSIGENRPRILDLYGSDGPAITRRTAWLRRTRLWLWGNGEQVEIAGATRGFPEKSAQVAQQIDAFVSRATR